MCNLNKLENKNQAVMSILEARKLTVSEKQEKRRREIAMAVREFIMNSNFDSITVDDICNATGIAKGTFYHYFNDKDSLMDQVLYPIDDFFDSLESELIKCDSFVEAIRQYAECYSTYVSASGLKMCRNVILAMMNTNNTTYVSRDRKVINILYEIIEYWQNKGEVTKEYSAEKICDIFVVVLRGYLLNWYSCNGSYDLTEAITLHTRITALGFLCK
jgi:AcrR family transcriptional regulator